MPPPPPFPWPGGKKAALSLSFDDTRLSQVDLGVPLLDALGLKATFYASPVSMRKRLEAWRQAVARGHEIGNHTLRHPCSCNFGFVTPDTALENYTLDRMENELLEASAFIEREVGVRPRTFGYPCGQKFVGRGEGVQSYVPLVARHFLVGRGWRDESSNNPTTCDLAQVFGVEADGLSPAEVRRWLDDTAGRGNWLVLVGHETCTDQGRQNTLQSTLEEIGRYVANPKSGFWMGTVAEVGAHVARARAGRDISPIIRPG